MTKNKKPAKTTKKAKAKRKLRFARGLALSISLLVLAAEVGSVFAVQALPESAFLDRITIEDYSLRSFESFNHASEQITQLDKEFQKQKILWTSDRGEKEIQISEFQPQTNLDILTTYLNDFDKRPAVDRLRVFILGEKNHSSLTVSLSRIKESYSDTEIEQPLKEAAYYFENGEIKISPEQTGYEIDTLAILKALNEYHRTLNVPTSEKLPLVVHEPTLTTKDLEAHIDELGQIINKKITLQDPDGAKWTVVIKDHLNLIIPDGESYKVSEDALNDFLNQEIATEVETEPVNATITENEDGIYAFEGSARRGRMIDRAAFYQEFQNVLNSEEDTLTLPIIETDPVVTVPDSLKEKGVTDLVGYGYSLFYDSTVNRIHNLTQGIATFNGQLIAPGEEFSFTTRMGPIDAAHGYRAELVIKGNDTKPEYGGGMCQVSSTMFRAALYSGLPITARKNHSYAVSYYAYPNGYGLDATVYDPLPDLRFINDTENYLLIQGYTEGKTAYFVFYGTYDGRKVEMDGPYSYNYHSVSTPSITYTSELPPGERKFKEYAHTGFDVDWYRTIITADGTASEPELFHSSYEARPPQYYEGTPATE
ncbi:VanW family protein [Patescibacteria group bacterium]|nr:VanW family protein [Patescibacteria group bacterium]